MNRKTMIVKPGRWRKLYLALVTLPFLEQELSFSFCTGPANYVVGRVNSAEEVEEKREESSGFIV